MNLISLSASVAASQAVDNLPVPSSVCANSLWDNIKGWEVIVAVLIIIGGWAATNIARMHFMVKMAELRVEVKPPVKRTPRSVKRISRPVKNPVKNTPKA